jgi:transcriptional antiterminator RfaH
MSPQSHTSTRHVGAAVVFAAYCTIETTMTAKIVLPSQSWIVATTHPHRECIAVENLVRQGFEAYCPMLMRRIRHARRTHDALRPMFRGYVFVAHEPDTCHWRPILSTYGIRSLVRCGEAPGLLDGAFEIDGAIKKPEQPFLVGQQVAINGGAFDGLIGEIIGLQDKHRVLILLNLLNGVAKAQISANELRAVQVAR